jgi:DNA topoisomerase-1
MATLTTTREQQSKRRASKAQLEYVDDFEHGMGRRRRGRGFVFLSTTGRPITSPRTKTRIDQLVIPPAWQEVWICPKPNGHIQARGRDEAGRIQYIYHERWNVVSSATKFDRMLRFAEVLPRIRRRVRKDLNRRHLDRERVLAAMVRVMDTTCIRVGGEAAEDARGVTTLESENVELSKFSVTLNFVGKSGKEHVIEFHDPKVAKVVRQCEDLDGQRLFSYAGEDGEARSVTSTLVNRYLAEIAQESITAKDFRTWWGSVIALEAVSSMTGDESVTQRKKLAVQAVKAAAEALGNTVAVCRKSYIHPGLLAATESGELPALLAKTKGKNVAELTKPEVLFAELLPKLQM